MTVLEGCLIVIGIIAIVISYFISEKNAEERMKQAVDQLVLSEETKRTLIKQAQDTIEETLNGMSEEIAGKAEIQLEKLSNEKIMMVHEYSDTVLEEIGKNHQEVMFLYSMLDDKERDVKNTVRETQKTVKSMRELSQVQEYAIGQMNSSTDWYLGAESIEAVDLDRDRGENADSNQTQISNQDWKRNQNRNLNRNQNQNQSSNFNQGSDWKKKERRNRSEGSGDAVQDGSFGGNQERNSNRYQDQEQNIEKDPSRSRKKRSRKKNREKQGETRNFAENTGEYLNEDSNSGFQNEIEENPIYPVKNEESKRDRIIGLYRQGKSKLEIAKEMKLSTGEVNLVLDLYYESRERKGNRK